MTIEIQIVGHLVVGKIELSECKLIDLISPSVHGLKFVLVAQVVREFELECDLLRFLLGHFQLHSQQKQPHLPTRLQVIILVDWAVARPSTVGKGGERGRVMKNIFYIKN